MKELMILTIYFLIFVTLFAIGIWLWWFADCEVLKNINYTMPGRCW